MKNIQFLQLDFNLITDTRITSNEFRIYAYLLSLYNDNKKCSYPSLETIANKLNISLTTVKKSIKRLAELGYMKIEKKKADRGFFNTYTSFKNMIKKKINKKSSKKAEDNKTTPVDSNGEKPLDGQVHVDELLDGATPELQANDFSIDPKEIELVSNETGLEENQAKELLKIANTSRILEVYEYSKDRANELFSYMFSAIKKNWTIRKNYAPAPSIYVNNENIETGRGNYTSNNSKRFKRQVTEEEIRKAEELESDLLAWY